MRRALRLALLAVAVDAAAKFALEKKGQKVLNVKLYETGYTFTNRGDKEKKPQTLREISGCSFGKKRDNGRREITLVEDKGYIITSSVLVKGDVFRNPQFDKDAKATRTSLGLLGKTNKPYDVEAVAFLPKSLETSEKGKGKLSKGLAYLVGTESPPDILAVDEAGSVVSRPFKIPLQITQNAKDNVGFEATTGVEIKFRAPHAIDATLTYTHWLISTQAMTIARGGALGLDKDEFYVVATIEYSLQLEHAVNGQHEVLVWKLADGDPDNPPLPIKTLSYKAGVAWHGKAPMGIVEFEPLENSLLVLERSYDKANGASIMLYEAAPVGDRLEKQRLFTWDKWSLRDGNDDGIPVDKKIDKAPAVDNYEGMCLVPAEDEVDATKSRRLLLVNDDNSNQKQVGTQFVLLRLPLKGTEKAPKPVPKAFPDTSAPTPPEPYIEEGDDSVHVTLYSIAVLSLCALLAGVIAAAATHVAMKQKSVQMLERSKAPWQSYGSRDEEGAPLIAKRPSLSFSV